MNFDNQPTEVLAFKPQQLESYLTRVGDEDIRMSNESSHRRAFGKRVLKLLCLRREYFKKLDCAPLSENKGDFQFYGHRLSSLYRVFRVIVSWLINRYLISNFNKYSNPTLSTGATA